MTMVAVLAKKLASLVLFVVNLFRRLLCFLGRRRRDSGMILPMTSPSAVDGHNHTMSVPSSVAEPFEMESWDNWGEDGSSARGAAVGNAAAMGSSNSGMLGTGNAGMMATGRGQPGQETDEQEPDYFSDMTPQFKRTTRILVKKNLEDERRTNRLNMAADLTYNAPGLGTWDDGENAWEGDLDDDLVSQAEGVIREKRRQERERRLAEHQKKKMDKDLQRNNVRDSRLGVRLS